MTKLQQVFIKNLRIERKKLRLTQEQAAEKIGITHSFYAALEGKSGKFPSVANLEAIGKAFGIPVYRLFLDKVDADEMPSTEMLDRFIDFLEGQYKKNLVEAKKKFLKALESGKRGFDPFAGDPMFKE